MLSNLTKIAHESNNSPPYFHPARWLSSYHPRYQYQKDIGGMESRFFVLVGAEDSVNDLDRLVSIFGEQSVSIVPNCKHMQLVNAFSSIQEAWSKIQD